MKEFIVRVIDPEEIQWYEEEPETPELVRCKDCKYWQTNTQFCTRWSAPFATQHTSPNWYCADAKRKDGEHDANGQKEIPEGLEADRNGEKSEHRVEV